MLDGMRKPKRLKPRTTDPVTGALVDLETGEFSCEWVRVDFPVAPAVGNVIISNYGYKRLPTLDFDVE